MSKMQLLVHEQKQHWNGISWRKQHKGTRRFLNCLWSNLLQRSCWRFLKCLIRVWDTSFDMHFMNWKEWETWWHHPLMQVILCEKNKHGMECNLMGVGIQKVHLIWRTTSNLWFPCIKDDSWIIFIFKPFHYFKFNCSIKIWNYFYKMCKL
jgi:hypothetical protein